MASGGGMTGGHWTKAHGIPSTGTTERRTTYRRRTMQTEKAPTRHTTRSRERPPQLAHTTLRQAQSYITQWSYTKLRSTPADVPTLATPGPGPTPCQLDRKCYNTQEHESIYRFCTHVPLNIGNNTRFLWHRISYPSQNIIFQTSGY